ncbi:hypothetical protein pb186bvf_003118 [Paramecium bursaria]
MYFLIIIVLAYGQQERCYQRQSSYEYHLSTNEYFKLDIQKELITGDYLQYYTDADYPIIQQPIHSLGESSFEIQNVKSAKAYMDQFIHKGYYSFMSSNFESVKISYAQTVNWNTKIPTFNNFFEINIENLNCFDHDYIEEKVFILACTKDEYLFIIIINVQLNMIVHLHQELMDEKIQQLAIIYQSEIYLMMQIADESKLRVYQLQQSYFVSYLSELNIQEVSLQLEREVKLNFVQLSKGLNGQVYVLDQYLGILQLELISNMLQIQNKLAVKAQSGEIYDSFDFVIDIKTFILKYYVICRIFEKSTFIKQFDDKFQESSYQFITLDSINNLRIYGTLNYLLLLSNQAYIFRITESDGIIIDYKFNLPSFIIANKFQDYILSIELSRAKLFEISQGYLIFYKKQFEDITISSFNLTTNSTKIEENVCSFQITYTINDEKDSRLYLRTNYLSPLPNLICYPRYPQLISTIQRSTTGPNQKATCQSDEGIEITINQYDKIVMGGQDWPNTQNIIFIDLMQSYNQLKFYAAVQKKDSGTIIYLCNFIKEVMKCYQQGEFPSRAKLSSKKFQWKVLLNDKGNTQFAYVQENQHQIYINEIINENIYNYAIINIVEEDSQVNDIKIIGDLLIYLVDRKNLTTIYSIPRKKDIYYIALKVKPLALYANSILKPHLLYIKTSTHILIYNIVKQPILIDQLIFENQNADSDLIITANGFNIIYKSQNQQYIEEYIDKNYQPIMLTKTIPLYHYHIITPFIYQQLSYGGNYIIAAQTLQDKKIVLLFYNSKCLLRECLFQVIDVGTDLKFEKLILAATGIGQYWTFFVYNQNISQIKVSNLMTATMNFNIKNQTISPTSVSINFYNDDYPNQIKLKQEIKFVNLLTQIKFDPTIPQNIDYKDGLQQIYIERNWTASHILGYDISCAQCTSDKSGLVFLTKILDLDYDYSFDTSSYISSTLLEDTQQIAILTSKEIIITSYDMQVVSTIINIKQDNMYTQQIASSNGNIFVLVTKITSEVYLWTYSQKNGNYIKTNDYGLNQTSYYKLKAVNNIIMVQDNSRVRFFVYQNNKLSETKFKFDYFLIRQQLYLVDVILFQEEHYRLFILDTYKNVYQFYLNLIDNEFEIITNTTNDLQNIIQSQGFLFEDLDTFQKIFNLQDQLLIISQKGIGFIVNLIENKQLYDFQVVQWVQRYGDSITYQDSLFYKNYIVIIYVNQLDYSELIITLYKYYYVKEVHSQPLIVDAGIIKRNSNNLYFTHLLEINGLISLIFNKDLQTISKYNINQNAIINIRNVSEFKQEQQINLLVYNTFSNSEYTFKFNIILPSDKSGFMDYVYLALAAIVILTGVIIIVLLVKQHRLKRNKKNRIITSLN